MVPIVPNSCKGNNRLFLAWCSVHISLLDAYLLTCATFRLIVNTSQLIWLNAKLVLKETLATASVSSIDVATFSIKARDLPDSGWPVLWDSNCFTSEYRPVTRVPILIFRKQLQSTDRGRRQHKRRLCVLIINILFVPQYKTKQHLKLQVNLESTVYKLKCRKKKK